MMQKTLQLYIYFYILITIKACLNITVSLNQKIENPGFHKTINWLLTFDNDIKELKTDFAFALYLKIPPGIYVNPDEFASLVRQKELNGRLIGKVNIEYAMHLSDSHEVMLFFEMDGNDVVLSLPIHLRYQKASFVEEFGEVLLEKPSLFANYLGTNTSCDLNKNKGVDLPCSDSNGDCKWVNITYKGVFDESILLVPIGNLNHYPIVAISTILLGCLGCLYILSMLMSTKLKRE
ncbi:phosphatidylinositol-glycan biosynthesis class X protein [Onthophagus taurus]|uniref:phosphatidylinositol-glycan biosynthesis class X protein n=1 Tax=Onthophagus taurus TaxID=166361 RepID=UPI0039BE6A78